MWKPQQESSPNVPSGLHTEQAEKRLLLWSVCAAQVRASCQSLYLKESVTQSKTSFPSAVTEWGRKHDGTTTCQKQAVQHHTNVTLRTVRVCLSTEYPILAASPDSLVSCSECTVQVNCPYSGQSGIEAVLGSKDLCLETSTDGLRLKRTHSYFYWVQTQLVMCRAKYCGFVVWTPLSVHIERIMEDNEFFHGIWGSTTQFYTCWGDCPFTTTLPTPM